LEANISADWSAEKRGHKVKQCCMSKDASGSKSFENKVLKAAFIVALIFAVLWLLKAIFNVLLLVLAGALIAVYFRSLGGLLHHKLYLPTKWSVVLAVVLSLLLVAIFLWFAGTRIQKQASELSDTLPNAVENVKQRLSENPVGQKVLQRITSGSSEKKLAGVLKSFFRSTFGIFGDLYVVIFLGIFFTAAPDTYINGFVKLVPPKARDKTEKTLDTIGVSLSKWLKGKLLAMFVVAVLTLVGLLIIGVPMAFTLALLAGLLNFIPNFGPLISMIPAVLVSLMQDTTTALIVVALYIFVQALESNVITPQIQKKLINIPPALIILAQLIMGVLTGSWGLLLATPVMLIVMLVLREVYIKPMEQKRSESALW
jgi:predicted PurR-regulated permease PerM